MLPTLGFVVAAVTCWYVATQVTDWPPYQTHATLLVEKTPDAEQVGASAEGIHIAQETIAALVVREPLTTDVAASLDLGLNAHELAHQIRVEIPEGAPIIEIVATDAEAENAAAIANAIAQEASRIRSPLARVSVLSEATVPESPLFSSYLVIAVAGLLGALIAMAAVALSERVRGKIRTEEDVRAAQLPLLGAVEVSAASPHSRSITQEWILARLLTELGTDARNVLFTAPRHIDSQEFFLARLLNTQLEAAGIGRADYHPPPIDLAEERFQSISDYFPDDEEISHLPAVREEALHTLALSRDPLTTLAASAADPSVLRLVDGPPVLTDPSTVLFASRFDAVVLLVESNTSRVDEAQFANSLLVESGANVLGTILLV